MYFNSFFIKDIIQYATSKGTEKGIFIDEEQYLIPTEKPDLVNYEQIAQLLIKAVEATNDDFFGLHLGEYYTLKATEGVDNIMQLSLTVEEAFNNAVEYSRLISDSMECELLQSQDSFGVAFDLNPEWALQPKKAIRHNLEVALISAQKSLVMLTGFKYYPKELRLPYEKPKQFNEYYRAFNCVVSFNQPRAEILFDKRIKEKGIPNADVGLLAAIKQNANYQLEDLPTNDDIVTQVKRIVLKNIEGNSFPTIETVAEKLNTTPRTLQRSLKETDATYNEILLSLKMKMASRYLVDDSYKVEETAYLVGYSEVSSFTRAFKKWKGISPKAYAKAAILN